VGVLNQSGGVLTGTERDGIPAQLDLKSDRTEIRRIDGRSMLVTGVQSGRTGWTYAAVVPVEGVLQRVETIRRVVVGVVVVTVLVGLGVAAVMAHRHTKPVQLLLHDNRALHDELERQAPFLRAAFLERLFRGEFYSEEETRSVIDHVDVDLRGAGYTAILVEVGADLTSNDQLASVQRRRIIVRDALYREGGSMKLVMHDMYDHRIAVIAVHTDEDPDIATGDVDRLLRRWSRVLQTHGLPDIRFGVGSFRRELTGVAASFEEARSALAYLQFLQSSTVAWFGDLSPSKRGYYYPQELETRLMNAVRAGDAGAVEHLLSEIREKNINERTLSQEFVRLLAYDLWATVLKLLEERVVRDDELTEEARSSYTQLDPAEPHIALDACARALYKLCASVEARKKSHNTSVADRIKAFIERRYADPALSLTLLSEEFSVSEAYLSGLFKEQTGENLSTYLQSVRMHHAKRLLEGSYISVKEIGRRVGYPSYSTFARAFKRVFGVSASDYRSR
jgi:AraC-like DNA-binding protein